MRRAEALPRRPDRRRGSKSIVDNPQNVGVIGQMCRGLRRAELRHPTRDAALDLRRSGVRHDQRLDDEQCLPQVGPTVFNRTTVTDATFDPGMQPRAGAPERHRVGESLRAPVRQGADTARRPLFRRRGPAAQAAAAELSRRRRQPRQSTERPSLAPSVPRRATRASRAPSRSTRDRKPRQRSSCAERVRRRSRARLTRGSLSGLRTAEPPTRRHSSRPERMTPQSSQTPSTAESMKPSTETTCSAEHVRPGLREDADQARADQAAGDDERDHEPVEERRRASP